MRTTLSSIMLFTVLTTTVAQLQFQPGVYSLAGQVSYSSGKEEALYGFKMDRTYYTLSPEVSYFVTEGLEVTFRPTYARADLTYTSVGNPTTETGSISLGLALGLRNYLIRSSVAPFVGAGGNVWWTKGIGAFDPDSYSTPAWEYFAEAGVSFAVTSHFAVEPTLQYRATEDDMITGSGFELAVRFKYFVFE